MNQFDLFSSVEPEPEEAVASGPQELHAARLPLWGSRLIEASAGTGKTWTIAALYLRLVLGHGGPDGHGRPLTPSEILVMTFTRAATRELSDRIRQRLLEAAQAFRQPESVKVDPFLEELLAAFPDEAQRRQAAWRLALAAESMDEASIHTIDAWCQRTLREHAFDSGSLFDEELVADEEALLVEAVQDYWRQQCYPLERQQLDQVLAVWPDVEALRRDVKDLLAQGAGLGDGEGSLIGALTRAQAEVAQRRDAIRAQWVGLTQDLLDFVQSQDPPGQKGWNGRKFSVNTLSGWLGELAAWASGKNDALMPKLTDTAWKRFTPEGLSECWSAGSGMPALPRACDEFAQLQAQLEALPAPAVAARLHAAASVAHRLQQLKSQAGRFGFADMLERLHAALQGDSGASLRQRILAQHPVALIDEFQDTSPLQYGIFDRIYQAAANQREQALLLIGDPKQSIYGFRGADIYSYLQARQATEGRHYMLRVNYRSTTALMGAVNHCFLSAERESEAGAFGFGSVGANPLPYVAVAAKGREERWVGNGSPLPALTLVHDLEPRSSKAVRKLFAARCAEQIVGWLNDEGNGFARAEGRFERLRPRDIAVLVRTGKEAAAVRFALQRRGVASVYLSDLDSVFQSEEARDLVHWLRGVAAPQDAALVRAALALRTLDLSLAELDALFGDDEAFDRQALVLRELQQAWKTQGVLAMLRQSLHHFELAARWLAQDGGERRLTNFLHLAELLQNASRELEGEQALIRWLQHQIDERAEQGEEQVVRLESDDDLVKIVTVHKSKGLEYPVVCLPFGTSFREVTRQFTKSATLPGADGARELVLQLSVADLERADRERLREDLRLLYVAMTRPRHAIWIGFSSVKVGKSNKCQSRKSALGHLVGGSGIETGADWLAPLQRLAAGQEPIALVDANARDQGQVAVTRLRRQDSTTELAEPLHYDAEFDRQWTIASYSRLTRELKTQGGTLSPFAAPRPADDEVLQDADEVLAPQVGRLTSQDEIQHRLKRGALSGNFLHEQLEWLAGAGFALADDPNLCERLRQRIAHSPYQDDADALLQWLQAVVQMPLPGPEVALTELRGAQAELEFWLPTRQLQTERVDQLCREHLLVGLPRPQLQSSELHGMLMGFTDLVFEHEGRYWVLDYKSNHLGTADSDYGAPALAGAMARHRYDVQAAIYLLALHRLLKSRLGEAYDPAEQLGGAIYLFLRGIEGPARGCCLIQPSPELLDSLDAMLNPQEQDA
jgi:exodeoxyribonuclease V beta subunit